MGLGPKTGFFWAGICIVCLCWTFFRLPEPKGRTYGELDILFERGVSARKFHKTVVDPFVPEFKEDEVKEKVEAVEIVDAM